MGIDIHALNVACGGVPGVDLNQGDGRVARETDCAGAIEPMVVGDVAQQARAQLAFSPQDYGNRLNKRLFLSARKAGTMPANTSASRCGINLISDKRRHHVSVRPEAAVQTRSKGCARPSMSGDKSGVHCVLEALENK
jgi:hypothetical protein